MNRESIYFSNLYTLIEIAINNGVEKDKIRRLSVLMNNKNIKRIKNEFPEINKFIPYCKWYIIENKNILCMSAYYYDLYRETGLLPNLDNFDINPSRDKLEHWMYINPINFEINPEEGFEFAKKIYPDCNVWSLFLSGCARMNYYEEVDISLEQRIKYAIVEYMMRRTQFFTTEDFLDNEILHKKYKRRKEN